MIRSQEGQGEVAALWLGETPASRGLWARLRAEHARTGLWPLLLDSRDHYGEEFRPWATGEVSPERMSEPQDHDPAALLASWWRNCTRAGGDAGLLPADERLAMTAPFGRTWPGLAPGRAFVADPEEVAAEYGDAILARRPRVRLGLVPAACGAHALATMGWEGPVNHDNDTGKHAAVVHDWERRFGVRVVALGFSTLYLSVAAPPASRDEALHLAAEHFAFCPDRIWQETHPATLAAYADQLIGATCWEFWWD
ncbi:DUF4253 domain-containing protein [Bailinhaonella thermotolerans]|uniref:DUF4253 domain-containing protein n=1 Tax=Bailinhaonella thermotolerans TaxID=1070861 RepID=UPI001F5B2855|nr:DUF4253 domain-containing protein [Bailinhaonella thermotolerans]